MLKANQAVEVFEGWNNLWWVRQGATTLALTIDASVPVREVIQALRSAGLTAGVAEVDS